MRPAATRSDQTGEVETETPPITSMDRATAQQWRQLGAAQDATSTAARVILALRLLDQIHIGFPVTQHTHCLQVASRAERPGADTDGRRGCLSRHRQSHPGWRSRPLLGRVAPSLRARRDLSGDPQEVGGGRADVAGTTGAAVHLSYLRVWPATCGTITAAETTRLMTNLRNAS